MKNLKYFRLFENISSDDLNTLGELKDIFDILDDDWGSNIRYFLVVMSLDIIEESLPVLNCLVST